MFGALPMRHVTLYLMKEELPLAALALAKLGVLDPDSVQEESPEASPAAQFRELQANASQLFLKIARTLGFTPPRTEPGALPADIDSTRLESLFESLRPVWSQCNRHEERIRSLREQIRQLQQQQRAVDTFLKLHLDLSKLSSDHRFLDIRVGSVESSELQRLRESLGLIHFKVIEFDRQEGRVHLVLLGLKGLDDQLNPVLRAAGYRTLFLPQGLKGYPRELHDQLGEKLDALEQELAVAERDTERLRERYSSDLEQAALVLAAAEPLAELADCLAGHGEIVTLSGWVPAPDVACLDARLERELTSFYREVRKPRAHEIDGVPSIQRLPALLRPFSVLVRNFGTPRYDEFDPTLLFALTFVLMFGSMFGDVGHGAVIMAAGWLLRRRIGDFRWLVVFAGLSSIAFGALYGSVFGSEDIIEPIWMSPLEDPVRLLLLAIYWGIGFIVLVSLLSVFNLWRLGLRRQALIGQRGLAGLVLYTGLVVLVFDLLQRGSVGWLAAGMVAAGLAGVIAGVWHETGSRGAERLLVLLIETAETLIGYASNTLSFLRVAAFSLNHAALAFAVITIAGVMGPAGNWITLLLGNLVILVLEGGIVLIQVLRLEYYEGFVRFFNGNGRAYRPLRLHAFASGAAGI
jgi:V/A-type H+-transporting ATPase subunit I